MEVNSRMAGPGFGLVRDPNWDAYADWDNLYFGSSHPGICQFVFGDGHVRALDVNINTSVLGFMATKADAEVVPSGAY